ncbi:DEAD/DEAH box helicase [Parafilimonas terrae]|uniref:Non-specific serine/threonine protein kinase n=1 Tax=Parafilimonas terrae TaxID=1465490 RepID=A0A1I5ZEP2_9BACT|nr:DEAD/DEAH box helicase [Parafilimonas terrae]SFQ54926.1 non-specific serine/threonine protein kinase [Parafilimonas terrae]
MALPQLIKYIYNNGTDEVIRRGKKIFSLGYVELVENDELLNSVVFRMRDDTYNTFYKVYLSRYNNIQTLSLRCTCPYNLGDICRHEAAALFRLQEMIDNNQLGETETEYKQQHTVVKLKQLELRSIKLLAAPDILTIAEDFLRTYKANITEAANDIVKAELNYEGETYNLQFRRNDERNLDTSCNCNTETHYPLCVHKVIVLLQLMHNHGPNFFDSISNRDREKNKLLALYGYTVDDNLEGKFEFTFRDGKPFLRVLDPSIKRVAAPAQPERKPFQMPVQKEKEVLVEEEPATTIQYQKLGVVLRQDAQQYPFIQADAVKGETDEGQKYFTGKIEKLDLTKFVNTEDVSEDDKMLLQHLRKLLPSEVTRYLNRNSPFSGIWENIIQQHNDDLPEETRYLITEYLLPKYKKLFSETSEGNFAFSLPQQKQFVTANIEPAVFSNQYIQPQFIISHKDNTYEVKCFVKLLSSVVPLKENAMVSPLVFQHENTFYLWQTTEDVLLAERFLTEGKLVITEEDWGKQLVEFILPLTKQYDVQFSGIQKEELKNIKPEMRLMIKEKSDYLLFQPFFNYNGFDVKPEDKDRIIVPSAGKLVIIHRNEEVEKSLIKKIENLHSSFIHTDDNSLALKGADVLKNNWFFLFADAVKDMNIPVYGFDALKKYRFNTAKPSTKIFISSNTDWFDARIDIHFGEQKVTVADVKKALANKQQFVPLQDGTLGILPEDWIRRYSMLFAVGEGKAANIKLSKYHFGVIEELYAQRNEEEIFFKLEEKYERLKEHHSVKQIDPPDHLSHVLRPYQVSGFQWLNYLSEVNWGGILADDMGLGKTVQALSFLHHYKTEHGRLRALVVCPTSLMFNWENEIKKFTPLLSWYIHHGSTRSQQLDAFYKSDIVITTYGTLRSDIQLFTEAEFDYVILDESQAIKNPHSKVTKAATLLNAKNRLCMSGTPLQNNTFDMYAQMNFLNPGMLGSMEFFRQEFAIPIDKFGEKEQKEHLRKLLYPFILRRTKEQVAKDLPEKSEMILFCEMGEEQRKIYDAYRNDYRDKILGTVEDKGVGKSQLTILQGLMKLRQICDSPSIINDDEKYPNVSVKLEELGREISENIGNHKALVFSQFLGMLALIKEKMKELGIEYAYFDGSTSAADREKAIQRFQTDENCRVFLISLKAGGVGLNLTAADYVYIVDPWWNPAVEQQAIDRTHRIGQTKNIFAYRMICQDTVEDKILKLQERKRALAADLITDDTSFVKSLTKEDVEYLFS